MQETLEIPTARRAPLSFYVAGKPQTAGSKSAIPNKGPGGRPLVVESGDRAAKRAWRADLRAAASEAIEGGEWEVTGPDVPLRLTVIIARARPKGHFGSGRNAGVLKDWARHARPVARPDSLKLVRAIEDALTKVVWHDDSNVVEHDLRKHFADQAAERAFIMNLHMRALGPHDEGVFVHVARLD